MLSPHQQTSPAPHSFLIPPTSSSEHCRFIAHLTPMAPASPALETDLIWDCYKNNNNPNAEKPQKGLRATHPSPPPSSPHSKPSTKPHPKQTFCTGGWVDWGASGRGGPGVALYKSRLVTAQQSPWGSWGAQEVCGCP